MGREIIKIIIPLIKIIKYFLYPLLLLILLESSVRTGSKLSHKAVESKPIKGKINTKINIILLFIFLVFFLKEIVLFFYHNFYLKNIFLYYFIFI
jgi:hypothetical protein